MKKRKQSEWQELIDVTRKYNVPSWTTRTTFCCAIRVPYPEWEYHHMHNDFVCLDGTRIKSLQNVPPNCVIDVNSSHAQWRMLETYEPMSPLALTKILNTLKPDTHCLQSCYIKCQNFRLCFFCRKERHIDYWMKCANQGCRAAVCPNCEDWMILFKREKYCLDQKCLATMHDNYKIVRIYCANMLERYIWKEGVQLALQYLEDKESRKFAYEAESICIWP